MTAPAKLQRRKTARNPYDTIARAAMFALLLTPLVIDYAARDDAYFAPKWAWMAIWTAAAWAALLGRACAGRAIVFPMSPLWLALWVWTAWQWIASLWAVSPSLGHERARQMIVLMLALAAGVQVFNARRALLRFAWGFIAIGLITALWVLLDDAVRAWFPKHVWIKPNLPDWRGYLAAGLGNTSHIGDLLALALLPALALWGSRRKRSALITATLIAALVFIPAGLIASYSVGSNAGLIGGAALMAALVIWRTRARWFTRRAGRWALVFVLWAIVVGVFVTDNPLNPHRPSILKQGFGSERWAEGWPTRLVIWAEGLEMVKQHPWRGVGTGNFTYQFPVTSSGLVAGSSELLQYEGKWTNAAHNEFLQSWAELGIGGLFLFIVVLGAAFHSLLANIREADGTAFLIRATLAGMLLAWLLQAQMNFSLQHPAGALTFYTLLLATLVEQRTRPRPGLTMPALLYDAGPVRLKIEWQDMRRPTALGVALNFPALAGPTLCGALLLLTVLWIPKRLGPVRAQREYAKAVQAEQTSDNAAAEAHMQRALKLDPNCTNCRSHYSEWLVQQRRGQDALDQLKLVRKRLNSRELYDREARAYALIGERVNAAQAESIFEHWPPKSE